MESRVGENGHFIGDDLSAADIMLSFPADIAVMQGMAPRYPKLAAFVNACHARPAWHRARETGGPYYCYSSSRARPCVDGGRRTARRRARRLRRAVEPARALTDGLI